MKKSYSKSELKLKAKAYFNTNESVSSVFATTDGQMFLEQNRANLHAGAEGKVFELENENLKSNDSSSSSTNAGEQTSDKAEDLIAASEKMENVEDVKQALDLENKRKKPRKTVIDAYEKKIEELTKAD